MQIVPLLITRPHVRAIPATLVIRSRAAHQFKVSASPYFITFTTDPINMNDSGIPYNGFDLFSAVLFARDPMYNNKNEFL